MTKMSYDSQNCKGVTSGATGKSYDADRNGFIHVDDPRDIRSLKAGGYTIASIVPRTRVSWECECGWSAFINHCPKCNRHDLTRVER